MGESLRIVFVGEVDCGKSTLIGRLLYDTDSISSQAKEELQKICQDLARGLEFAYLLDSFQEERLEEFTLDTTQVMLKLKNKEILLIDVPGHRALLKNMLTGSSYADAAVLVIDVKKSLEEQTKRHLYILKFLGIEQIILVINKMDTVLYNKEDFTQVSRQLTSFLEEIGLKSTNVIPVSAKEGDNLLKNSLRMAWYNGPFLIKALDAFTDKNKVNYDFRFLVQDIYEVKKEKIAVGTVVSGKIDKGDLVRIAPLEIELKVKAIKIFGQSRHVAGAKESIGLVFNQLPRELKRGRVLYKGKAPKVRREIQAKIFCLRSLGLNEELSINCATQETKGRIGQIKESIDTANLEIKKDIKMLNPLDAAKVIINTEELIIIERFQDLDRLGRFILQKDNKICAVGIID